MKAVEAKDWLKMNPDADDSHCFVDDPGCLKSLYKAGAASVLIVIDEDDENYDELEDKADENEYPTIRVIFHTAEAGIRCAAILSERIAAGQSLRVKYNNDTGEVTVDDD